MRKERIEEADWNASEKAILKITSASLKNINHKQRPKVLCDRVSQLTKKLNVPNNYSPVTAEDLNNFSALTD